MYTKIQDISRNRFMFQSNCACIGMALILLLFMLSCPCLAFAEPSDYSTELKVGKIFSMKEPWTVKDFGQKFSQMTCMKSCEDAAGIGLGVIVHDSTQTGGNEPQKKCQYGESYDVVEKGAGQSQKKWTNEELVQDLQKKIECKNADSFEIVQGKTFKNKAGKAYYLTTAQMYADYGYAVLGLRDMELECDASDKEEVQFYLLDTMGDFRTIIKQWGSLYRTYTHHEIVGLYQYRGVTFVEFDFVFTGEWNCGHPEMGDSKKCSKKQYESRVVRKVFMINSNLNYATHIQSLPRRAVVSVATIGNAEGVSSSVEGSIKAARKKIKSVKDLKSITFPKMLLDEDLNCTVEKDTKTKEYTLSCPQI